MRMLSFVCLVLLGFVQPLAAQPSARAVIGRDEQGVAVTMDGWERTRRPTGTVFFHCKAASCGADSVVSFHRQADGPLGDLATFRRQQEAINRAMPGQSGGQFLAVEGGETEESTTGDFRVMRQRKTIRLAGGGVRHMVSSLFSDGRLRYSLVSTANTAELAHGNLVIIEGLVMMEAKLNGMDLR